MPRRERRTMDLFYFFFLIFHIIQSIPKGHSISILCDKDREKHIMYTISILVIKSTKFTILFCSNYWYVRLGDPFITTHGCFYFFYLIGRSNIWINYLILKKNIMYYYPQLL